MSTVVDLLALLTEAMTSGAQRGVRNLSQMQIPCRGTQYRLPKLVTMSRLFLPFLISVPIK